jgi:hypothetical protein
MAISDCARISQCRFRKFLRRGREIGHRRELADPTSPTLGNMRANGVRSLAVSCHLCHHEAVLSADSWPDDMPMPAFGPRMVCTRCGIIGADRIFGMAFAFYVLMSAPRAE